MPTLELLPCLDSEAMALARRRELDIRRDVAASRGLSAVAAGKEGRYVSESGKVVDWSGAVARAVAAKESIPPKAPLPPRSGTRAPVTRVQVTNETTLGAARRLADSGVRPVALNFANGVSAGGGFISGARAQEEAICRSSALWHTLVGDEMYEAHRKRALPDSTEWTIRSPDVPVFRDDDGRNLDSPWLLSFLTCAAPYAPSIGQPMSGDLLERRIHRVLEIAASGDASTLVLGAWGCGAFGNDPLRTARDFRRTLEVEFSGAFAEIVFAVVDWSSERRFLGPFRDVFGPG